LKSALADIAGGAEQTWEHRVDNDSKLETQVTIEKLRNGRWAFVIKRGAVVHPATGQFTSQLQAHVAGQMALKALQNKR
jgi:hypothetical protein